MINQQTIRAKRQARLEMMAEQVASGTLVIRTMTSAEREAWERRRALAIDRLSDEEQRKRDRVREKRQERQRIRRGEPEAA